MLSGPRSPTPGLLGSIERDEPVRIRWEGTPIGLFCAYEALHRCSMKRRRRVDFHGDDIHMLSAEGLIVYKAIFDRARDWDDFAGVILACPEPLGFDDVRGCISASTPRSGAVDPTQQQIDCGGVERDGSARTGRPWGRETPDPSGAGGWRGPAGWVSVPP